MDFFYYFLNVSLDLRVLFYEEAFSDTEPEVVCSTDAIS
jgi:hypothetical protein